MAITSAMSNELPELNPGVEQQSRSPWQKPELLGQYLEMDHEEVLELLMTTEGRESLYDKLIEHQDLLEEQFPDLDIVQIRSDLEALGRDLELKKDVLGEKERFLGDVSSPEKKGMFRKAWESVRGFAKKHKIVVALLAMAAAAAGGYLAWNYLGVLIPIPNPMEGAAGVADVLVAPTGGAFEAIPQWEIVPPNLLPGSSSPNLPLPPMPTGTASDFFPPGLPQ
jgi:hypothetical protein